MTAANLATARIFREAGSAMPPDVPPLDRGLGRFALDFRGHLPPCTHRYVEARRCSIEWSGTVAVIEDYPPLPGGARVVIFDASRIVFFSLDGSVRHGLGPVPGLKDNHTRPRRAYSAHNQILPHTLKARLDAL